MMRYEFLVIFSMVFLLYGCGRDDKALMEKAREQMNKRDYENALPFLNRIIKNGDAGPDVYNLRGIARLELGRYNKAIKDFDRAIALDSGDYRSYYNKGNAYYRNKNYTAALENYDRALKLSPGEPDIYINRGNAHLAIENYDKAIGNYEKARSLNDDNYLIYFNLGRAYYLQDNPEKAKEYFEKALQRHQFFAPAWYFLGIIAMEGEDMSSACGYLQHADSLGYRQAKTVMEMVCPSN